MSKPIILHVHVRSQVLLTTGALSHGDIAVLSTHTWTASVVRHLGPTVDAEADALARVVAQHGLAHVAVLRSPGHTWMALQSALLGSLHATQHDVHVHGIEVVSPAHPDQALERLAQTLASLNTNNVAVLLLLSPSDTLQLQPHLLSHHTVRFVLAAAASAALHLNPQPWPNAALGIQSTWPGEGADAMTAAYKAAHHVACGGNVDAISLLGSDFSLLSSVNGSIVMHAITTHVPAVQQSRRRRMGNGDSCDDDFVAPLIMAVLGFLVAVVILIYCSCRRVGVAL